MERSDEIADLVVRHLTEILGGHCSITEEVIASHEGDDVLTALLTGLYYVHQELAHRDSKLTSRETIAATVTAHFMEILGGRCTITEDEIAAHSEDPAMMEILTGILWLHQDLTMQRSRLVRVEELQEANAKLDRLASELWSEIDLARKIQTVLLPVDLSLPDHRIDAAMMAATSVGGDYYDVIHTPEETWVLVGDVSGHGVSAGLIMMMVQTSVRTLVKTTAGLTPSALLTRVNHAVFDNLERIEGNQYMTITALRFRGGEIMFAGRHQNLLLHRAATGAVDCIETDGVWLGVVDDIAGHVHDHRLELARGDTLLLFSDGLTEAVRDGKMLDTEGLVQLFAREVSTGVDGLAQRLLAAMTGYHVEDDMTVVAVCRVA
jgi:serine phosphatase RsbU (regulator of sigma subunit)